MNTIIRVVAVRSSFMLTTANSAAFNIVRNQFAAVQPTLWISSSLVPARQFQTTVGTRDIGSTAKFIGAGVCTVGIAGSGAGSVYRSLIVDYARNRSLSTSLGQACHYTTESTDSEDKTDQHAKNIDGEAVVEYAENLKQSYYRVDFSKMSKEEVILYFGKKVGTLETQLSEKDRELRRIKSPAAARSKIEFYERENELTVYNLSEAEKKILMEMSDLKEKKIKQVEFKWRYLLSPANPKYNLKINQELLLRLKEEHIDVEDFCRAVGNVFEYTASRWYELFDMCGEPVIILQVDLYDRSIQCLFEKLSSKKN